MRIPWSWWFLLVVATRVLVRSQCDTKCKERVKRIIGEYVDTSQMDSYQFKSYRWTRNSPTTAGNPRWRVKQRFALACIYYAISGDAWDFNTGWLTDDDECTWDGIECNARGFVRKIDLNDNFLTGEFPPEVQLLRRRLSYLDVGGNDELEAKDENISAVLGKLTKLSFLSLYYTRFSSARGIPTELRKLTRLKSLYLDGNDYQGKLNLAAFASAWSQMQYFTIGPTDLSSTLPTEIGLMTSLISFEADDCALTGPIPTEIGRLVNLQTLSLRSNGLQGSLPSEMASMSSLEALRIQDNNLVGNLLPAQVVAWSNMQVFAINNNGFAGSLPTYFGLLVELSYINIASNGFTSSLPSEMSSLTKLNSVYLQDNDLTGSIPTEVCGFSFSYRQVAGDCVVCNHAGTPSNCCNYGCL